MHSFTSIPQFVGFLAGVSAGMPAARHHALEVACVIIETEAKRVLGTYDYRWPQLAESTQQARSNAGFPANEPGVVTGEMRDSIQHTVRNDLLKGQTVGHVGSDSDKLVWFELGTVKQPPRSVLVQASLRSEKKIFEAVGRLVHGHLTSGGLSTAGVRFDDVKSAVF